ncbi:MAG: hypothetical protein P1V20_02615 [Verrucomicrobiales bacterium]|nr:hypothetical protein [Verrucomicrobiales bacterium]
MSDSWIDRDELDDLVSGFAPGGRAGRTQREPDPEDLFDDIPAIHMPRSQQVSPHLHPAAQVQQESPLQMLVNRNGGDSPNFDSPFVLDEDDEFDEIEDQIEHLASEAAKALKTLEEVRARADQNGLTAISRKKVEPEIEVVETLFDHPEEDEEPAAPLDRIPLDVEIDPHLTLKGRLGALAGILATYVDMEEMMVVDRDGFTLYSTEKNSTVGQSVGKFVRAIRKVYESEAEARVHTASQLSIENGKWLCIIPTDGEIDGRFLLKALVPTPLDRPEIYVLVELLNEVLRPEGSH